MQLSCPSCKSPTRSEDINLDKLIAKCTSCHAVFRFSEDDLATTSSEHKAHDQANSREEEKKRRGREKSPIGSTQKRTRSLEEPMPLGLPKGMNLQRDEQHLRVSWRWMTPTAYFLLFFSIVWNVMAWSFFGVGLSSSLLFSLFPLIHVGAGLVIAYVTLALFLNATTLTIQHGLLSVQHAPLAWWGNRTLPVEEFDQFYCKEQIAHGKNSTTITYELHAILRNREDLALITGIDNPEKIFFLEELIEDHLGIVDRPVLGELEP